MMGVSKSIDGRDNSPFFLIIRYEGSDYKGMKPVLNHFAIVCKNKDIGL